MRDAPGIYVKLIVGFVNGDATDSSDPRTLSDGKTILVPTFNCGMYLVDGVGSDPSTAPPRL